MLIIRNKIFLFVLIISIFMTLPFFALAQTDISDIIKSGISVGQACILSIDEASRLALLNNFDIQLARYDAKISKTRKGESQSIYDTVLTIGAAYHKDKSLSSSTLASGKAVNNDYSVGISKKLSSGAIISIDQVNNRQWTESSAVTMNPSHDSSLGITVEQELGKNFFGIQDRGDVKITQIDIQNSEYSSLDKIEKSLADVQVAYWDLALAFDLLRIEKDMLLQAERLYLINREKLSDGLVEKPDFLASEANYKQRISDVAILKNTVETKTNVLKLNLNLTHDMSDIIPENQLALNAQEARIEASLINAFDHRRDYKQALNDVRMRNIGISMKKNNAWPEINLKASLARNGLGGDFNESIKNISKEDHPDFSVSLNVVIPLENRSARSQLKKAEFQKAQALIGLKMTEKTIMINVVDQVRLCNTLLEKAKQQKEIAELQAQKLKEQEKIFSYGRGDVDTIVRYQGDALMAQKQAAQALFDYKVALINLDVKQGILLQQYWQEGI